MNAPKINANTKVLWDLNKNFKPIHSFKYRIALRSQALQLLLNCDCILSAINGYEIYQIKFNLGNKAAKSYKAAS